MGEVTDAFIDYAKTIPFDQLKDWTKIGAGGFATVYRVRWNAAHCAVKVIKMDDMKDMQGNTDGELDSSYDIWSEAKFHRYKQQLDV